MTAGRKRAFDKQEALDEAMRVFWAKGYSGTSVSELTSALGINKPSLYAAFGNKEQLFKASLEHYMRVYGAPNWQKLFEPIDAPLQERLKAYLYGIIDLVSDPDLPKGCLFVKSTCESGSQAMQKNITAVLNGIGQESEKTLVALFNKEKLSGNLPKTANVKQLATYLMSVMYGIGVLAKNGHSKKSLRSAAQLAIQVVSADG